MPFKRPLYFNSFPSLPAASKFSKDDGPTIWHPWHFLYASYDVGANAMLS